MLLFSFLFGFCLSVISSQEIPRLNLRQDHLHQHIIYRKNVSHTVLYLNSESENLYVGGTNVVFEVNEDTSKLKNITLPPNTKQPCTERDCEYVVTVIEEFQNYLLVCGTNEKLPVCWELNLNQSTAKVGSLDARGISPYKYWQNYLSLSVDEDLYAAAPSDINGESLQFRRKAGPRTPVWMYSQWVREPTYISAFVARRHEDPTNEKIYLLFREKNSDGSRDADPWISRIARVCKVDEGGPKTSFQNVWTSFLKARIVCGIPSDSLYFNRLQDVFVLHSKNWKESLVYALFSSSWKATAVCIYSMKGLDHVFENSAFKGYSGEIPRPRPGTCVTNSKSLDSQTINIIKEHSEMTDWVYPIQSHTPFYISNNMYNKIAVDTVKAADNNTYNVVLLATASGTIHKILEYDSKAFIISETKLSNDTVPIQAMKLNSKKRKLFVGYPGQMSFLDLQRCQDYNRSCEDCVLSRDPYCAWTKNGCTSDVQGGIQNITTGDPFICPGSIRFKRKASTSKASAEWHSSQHFVPLYSYFYLSCPIESHHAVYSWMHDEVHKPCHRTETDCLYLIPNISEHDYGKYQCVSVEQKYKKFSEFLLQIPNCSFKMTMRKGKLLAVLVVLFLTTVH